MQLPWAGMRRLSVTGLVIAALLQTACGSTAGTEGTRPTTAGSPTACAASTPAGLAEALIAVTEGPNGVYGPTDEVAIIGLDGRERAKAQFTPMAVPALGCGETG